jgi:uncharacterized protein (TIGR00106 family)
MLAMFSTFPVDKGESLSDEVASVIELIDRSGLNYQTTAMGTLVEGDWDQVFDLIKRCHQALRQGSRRVYTRITVDDREGATNQLAQKVAAIEAKLGRGIRK